METAEKLFAVKGYSATSIREIAKSSGMNSAMISYYFGSKEQLAEAVLIFRIARLDNLLNQSLFKAKTPVQKLHLLVSFYIEKAFKQKYFYMLIMQLQVLNTETRLLNLLNSLRQANFELINDILLEGAENGMFKKNVDAALLIGTLVGTVNQIVLSQNYYREVNELESLSDIELAELLKAKVGVLLTDFLKVYTGA